MKRFFPAGERCGVFSNRDCIKIQKNQTRFISFITIVFFLFFSSESVAQESDGKSFNNYFLIGNKINKKTIIGSSLPDKKELLMLKDYRGAALIIDFWGTNCSTCIAKFPVLDSLKKAYGKSLNILLLNYQKGTKDSDEKILDFISSYKKRFPDFVLPFAIANNEFAEKFQFRTIPHYIWLDPNGRIKAITSSNEISNDNIKDLISGHNLYLKIKTQ